MFQKISIIILLQKETNKQQHRITLTQINGIKKEENWPKQKYQNVKYKFNPTEKYKFIALSEIALRLQQQQQRTKENSKII